MAELSDNSDDDKDPPKRPVGKNSPPREHQFKPGQSGNPRGRPRRTPAQAAGSSAHTTFDELVLEESVRPIELGSGKKRLTAERLVLRATFAKASKGSVYAQRQVLQMIEGARTRRLEQMGRLFAGWMKRKDEGMLAIQAARRRGQPEPFLFPHPDDIYPDEKQFCVWVYGGVSMEFAAITQTIRDEIKEHELNLERLRRRLKRYPKDREAAKASKFRESELTRLRTYDLDRPDYIGIKPESEVVRPPSRAAYHAIIRQHGPDVIWERRAADAKKANIASSQSARRKATKKAA